jgi:hypothetical protein
MKPKPLSIGLAKLSFGRYLGLHRVFGFAKVPANLLLLNEALLFWEFGAINSAKHQNSDNSRQSK